MSLTSYRAAPPRDLRIPQYPSSFWMQGDFFIFYWRRLELTERVAFLNLI